MRRSITYGMNLDWMAFNYKTTPDYTAKSQELCPNGIDCHFDNTGGSVSDAVFPLLSQIAHYNAQGPELGLRLLSSQIGSQKASRRCLSG